MAWPQKGAGRRVLRFLERRVLSLPKHSDERKEAVAKLQAAREAGPNPVLRGYWQRRLRGSLSGPVYVAACRVRDALLAAGDGATSTSPVSSPDAPPMSNGPAFETAEQLADEVP